MNKEPSKITEWFVEREYTTGTTKSKVCGLSVLPLESSNQEKYFTVRLESEIEPTEVSLRSLPGKKYQRLSEFPIVLGLVIEQLVQLYTKSTKKSTIHSSRHIVNR